MIDQSNEKLSAILKYINTKSVKARYGCILVHDTAAHDDMHFDTSIVVFVGQAQEMSRFIVDLNKPADDIRQQVDLMFQELTDHINHKERNNEYNNIQMVVKQPQNIITPDE